MGKHHRIWLAFFSLLTVLIAASLSPTPTRAQARADDLSFRPFTDDLNSFDSDLWEIANNWTNYGASDPNSPFDCGWEANNILFDSGVMSLQLDNADCPCSGRNYASGEYRSKGHYFYGIYTVRMQAVAQDGVVSSFFIYTGPSEGNPWDEIDIEILGKDPTQMQINYYTDGQGGHEAYIDLGFDAAADFHTYSIEWLPDAINWYVEGTLVHTEDGSHSPLPTTPGRIMMNFWPGTDAVNAWLGDFVYAGPIQAQYDWVSFEAIDWPLKNYLPLALR